MEGEKEKGLEVETEFNNETSPEGVSEEKGAVKESPEKETEDVNEETKEEKVSEIEKLKEELRAYEAQLREYHDRWLRAVAEFENFRKRTEREKEKFFEYALENFLREFLPILDALEKGIEAADRNPSQKDQLVEGVKLIYRNILTVLEKFGVKQIEAVGKQFDPFYHEAVSRVSSGEHEPGTVVEEFQRGYMLKDRVIRPSMVAVAVDGGEISPREEEEGKEKEPAVDKEEQGETRQPITSQEEGVSEEGGSEGEVPVEIIDEGSE